jgi:hypothetical protein
MVSFWEVADRAINTGSLMKMKDFDMKIFKVASQLVKEYGVKYDPKVPIPSDNALADRLFEAGLKLYLEVGTYCIDTERVIRFSEEEIREALADLKRAPDGIDIGEGVEKRRLFKRTSETRENPWSLVASLKAIRQRAGILSRCTRVLPKSESSMGSIMVLLLRASRVGSGYSAPPWTATRRKVQWAGSEKP